MTTQDDESERRRNGRPCLLTPERASRLFKAIAQGNSYNTAAALAGISFDTFNRWRKRGGEDDAPQEFREFCDRLRLAEAEGENAMVLCIGNAATKHWQAAAWYLERRNPKIWAKKVPSNLPEDDFDTF